MAQAAPAPTGAHPRARLQHLKAAYDTLADAAAQSAARLRPTNQPPRLFTPPPGVGRSSRGGSRASTRSRGGQARGGSTRTPAWSACPRCCPRLG